MGEYTYNGAGQRIKKVTQTETRIFHYDLRGHLIAETNQTGQMLAEYVYLGDHLLAMIKPGETVYYFHNDHLGTPQVLTDDTQVIAWKAVYTPFGGAVPSIQTVENPFRFPGQYYDSETGLHYNYFRYYDPTTGRYVTPDPIGLEGGINLWLYAANNPTNSKDPLGLLRKSLNAEEKVAMIEAISRIKAHPNWQNVGMQLEQLLKKGIYQIETDYCGTDTAGKTMNWELKRTMLLNPDIFTDKDFLLEVIVHEYVHHGQFTAPGFSHFWYGWGVIGDFLLQTVTGNNEAHVPYLSFEHSAYAIGRRILRDVLTHEGR